jgi:hypothetical protein
MVLTIGKTRRDFRNFIVYKTFLDDFPAEFEISMLKNSKFGQFLRKDLEFRQFFDENTIENVQNFLKMRGSFNHLSSRSFQRGLLIGGGF